jgi:hypothetical protein
VAETLEELKLERLQYLKDLQARAAALNQGVEKYFHDPVGFARDCIDWGKDGGLTFYQDEILEMLRDHKRVSVRGPHGLGKSTITAVTVLWFAITRDAAQVDWKVVTTAGAWRQLILHVPGGQPSGACKKRESTICGRRFASGRTSSGGRRFVPSLSRIRRCSISRCD